MRDAGHGVESTVRVLQEQGVAVAPRSYRAWKRRAPAPRTVTDAELTAVLHRLRDRDEQGRQAPEVLYGRRKMTVWLRRNGFPEVSKHTVDRLMRDEGMNGLIRGGRCRRRLNTDPRASDEC